MTACCMPSTVDSSPPAMTLAPPECVEQLRFTTTPKQPGTSTDCAALPCDAGVPTYTVRTTTPKLGAELWAFIPQDLLPQLRWLTSSSYSHVYYVDLRPKLTDARVFVPDTDHPGGWGTILIGGFRLGGSCTNCDSSGGVARVVRADFDGNGTTTGAGDRRAFLSSYFVLDVTNPEKDPVLLWTFRDMDLGFTTSVPAVMRVNPAIDGGTSSVNEKWYVVFGSGPTGYQGVTTGSQFAKFFIVDLKLGPLYSGVNQTSGTLNGHSCDPLMPCIAVDSSGQQVRSFNTGQNIAFLGDIVTLDLNLDFRVDVIYAGAVICNGSVSAMTCNAPTAPTWKGALYRLTTNSGNPDPLTWGVSNAPTKLISALGTCTAPPCPIGPITAAPAMTTDPENNLWLFAGTGRFYSTLDGNNTDLQHYYGIKDSFMTQGSPAQTSERNNLYDVSNVTICTSCASSANVSYGAGGYVNGFDSGANNLVGNVHNVDGWFTTLPTAGERSLSSTALLGGSLFFTTSVPSTDICVGSGTGYVYGLYYLTGTAYTSSALGGTTVGANTIANRVMSLGSGLPSNLALQIGAAGTGQAGGTSSAGCTGRQTGFIQSSTGAIQQLCSPASSKQPWSRVLTWRDM